MGEFKEAQPENEAGKNNVGSTLGRGCKIRLREKKRKQRNDFTLVKLIARMIIHR